MKCSYWNFSYDDKKDDCFINYKPPVEEHSEQEEDFSKEDQTQSSDLFLKVTFEN